jgi:dihydrofolate reductase
MGELVVTEFVTLDGVMEDPGGAEGTPNGGWAFKADRGPEGDAFKLGELEAADAQLLGRVTYEGFAAAWPSRPDPPFGERMNSMPKFVYSETLKSAEWQNTTVLDGELRAEVSELKERFAGDILVAGSRTLVRSLLALDLVDRLNLMVFPMVLGSGKRLFDDALPRTFAVTSVRQMAEVVVLTYARTGGGTARVVPIPPGAPQRATAA